MVADSPHHRRKYTKEMLRKQLLAKAINGKMPTIEAVNADPTMAAAKTFMNVFGKSWSGIAREIGLKPNKKDRTKPSRKQRLDLKKKLLNKSVNGMMPPQSAVDADPTIPDAYVCKKVFGKAWGGIANEIGLKPNKLGDTKAELKKLLLNKSVNGKMPSQKAVDADSTIPSADTFKRAFGKTWTGIAEEVGLAPDKRGQNSRRTKSAPIN